MTQTDLLHSIVGELQNVYHQARLLNEKFDKLIAQTQNVAADGNELKKLLETIAQKS